jgi:hypothetical protein
MGRNTMANEKNLEKRKKFSTENQPAKRGRRRSQLGDFIAENEVSLGDLKMVLMEIAFNRSVAELEKLLKDKTIPAAVSFVTAALLSDMRRGRLDALDSLLDRVYGKPVQVEVVEVRDVSEEAKRRMLSIYQEEAKVPVKPKNVMPRRVLKMKPGA